MWGPLWKIIRPPHRYPRLNYPTDEIDRSLYLGWIDRPDICQTVTYKADEIVMQCLDTTDLAYARHQCIVKAEVREGSVLGNTFAKCNYGQSGASFRRHSTFDCLLDMGHRIPRSRFLQCTETVIHARESRGKEAAGNSSRLDNRTRVAIFKSF